MSFKIIILGCLILFLSSIAVFPASASNCRQIGNHSICLLSIKRSAKNYWEYRAAITVDGQKKPIEIYNCRDRIKIDRRRTIVPFTNDGIGELVCRLYTK